MHSDRTTLKRKKKKERKEKCAMWEHVVDAISRGSDIRCCASEVQKHRGEIDEHPETLKTCRRSAIGTALLLAIDRRWWTGIEVPSRCARSSSFFYLSADDVEERWRRWRRRGGGRSKGEGEEVAEKSLNHAPSEYGRNYCRRLMSRCSRDASSLYEESSSSSLSSPPFIFHRSHREKTTNSFHETGNSQVSILLFSCC